jgi:tetratricopeptide (TPR) repeat protein
VALTLEDLAADGQVVWDDAYLSRADSTDLFDIQAQVAKSVSSSLKVAILAAEQHALDELPTDDLGAYALYVEGLGYQARATNEGLIASIERFDAAIQRDPEFALAHIAKADSYRIRLGYYEPPAEMLSHVRAAATDALTVDPDSAEARSVLGLAYLHAWRWRDAWRYLSDANQRDPTIGVTHLGFALYYVSLGDKQRALDALAEATRLDPLNVEIADWGQWVITMTGDHDRAIAWADEKTRLFPDVGFVFADASLAYSLAGSHAQAVALAEKGARLDQRGPFSLLFLAQAYAGAGRIEEAREALAEAERSETYVCPYETATSHIALGNLERAFELIDHAVVIRSNCLIFTREDPRLEPLRPDPRFAELLVTVGLDDASVRSYER